MLLGLAQRDIDERWHYYEQLAGVERKVHEQSEIVIEREPGDLEDDDA